MNARFPDGSPVLTRYPLTPEQQAGDRSAWPWVPGTVLECCGPNEWRVRVGARELATLKDGSPAPDDTEDDALWFPVCFRDASELRPGGIS